ncbi:MAG: hypothetical protein KAY46_03895 [Burkholderiaceae bacterium]|nr:hypothetical protein [Burkholderiaceae bacterium]MBP8306380.1 hypothetical protein [Burkholderiaceae bacterium]
MAIGQLLGKLELVRKGGRGRWIARCPAHADKDPSLSVRELGDGRILIHCFAGCAAGDVLTAIGVDMSALFPDEHDRDRVGRSGNWQAPANRRDAQQGRAAIHPADALACVAADAALVAVVASDVARRRPVSEAAVQAVWRAAGRLAAAVRMSDAR